jgi:hypothetical protein
MRLRVIHVSRTTGMHVRQRLTIAFIWLLAAMAPAAAQHL